MTDEIDDAQPQDATNDPRVPSVILQLGVEARAEYIRARQWLGLTDGPAERLGTVGRYRLEAELGRGGMGIVFRASDPELDRPVAIKLVQAVPFARYDKLRTRLLREAKVLAKLTHPNVVRIYDCGQHEGEVYLAMELVEGTTLREWQRERERSERSILDAYQQAARGLAAAHELGITHRDFKPDNVLVASDGRVLVGDFGLAGVPAGDELRTEGTIVDGSPGERVSATRSGALLGTPAYMAPEQLRGDGATALSDQFAFCVSLWEALAGERPFAGEKREELLGEIENGRVRGAERLPRRVRGLLLRGLAAEPGKRFGRLQDVIEALGPRKSRMGVAALSVSLVAALGVVAWLTMRKPPCDLPAELDEIAAMEEWMRADARPELAPIYEDLRNLTWNLRIEAEAFCQPSNDEQVVRRAWLENWIDYLRLTLEQVPKEDLTPLRDAVRLIQNERRNGPPPRQLSDEVNAFLQDSYTAQLTNDLDKALSATTNALDATSSQPLERAVAYQRRGRILALMGKHGEAMAAYRNAMTYAEPASYPSARLVTALLAAKTAAMRLEDFERAHDFLAIARGLMIYLQEPLLSPRRADYHEILAAALKHQGQHNTALLHQGYALLVYRAWGEPSDIGRAFTNLGTIYELRNHGSDLMLARICYERALQTLDDRRYSPEWFQVAFNFGHWLVVYGKEDEWSTAEDLLELVRSESEDAAPSALTDLVLLGLHRVDAATSMTFARELEVMLFEDASSETPSISAVRRLNAWQNIANAYSLAEDLAGFEAARSTFVGAGREVVADGSLSPSAVQRQMAEVDLTAAFALSELTPERALQLAIPARNFFFRSLPGAQQAEELKELKYRIERADELIDDLTPSTPPAAPPPPSDNP